jgi:hypothetical protein
MSGLESIALAVAQLEQSSGASEAPYPSYMASSHRLSSQFAEPPEPFAPSCAPPPVRCGFQQTSRIVSQEYSPPHGFALPFMDRSSEGCDSAMYVRNESPYHNNMNNNNNYIAPTLSHDTDPVVAAQEAIKGFLLTQDIHITDHSPVAPPHSSEPITHVQQYDVLCGRGGETNHHSGNIQYRHLVKVCQPAYISAKRRDKPKISESIVSAVRKMGGRFLKKDPTKSIWYDVGNVKAREKTSQALREGAPELRNSEGGKGDDEDAHEYVPALVNVSDADIKVTPKKRRVSVPCPVHIDSSSMDRHSPSVQSTTQECMVATVSPRSFATTVSNDDDDSRGSSEKSARGPRIKLLKRRLESDSHM